MANIKLSFATTVTLTITNANLASSATAGWQSAGQDNTSNLYLDAYVHVNLAAVNTAPASSKAIFMYAFGVSDGGGTDYTSTGDGVPSGSEGTLTYPDITANALVCPLLGVIPYPVQNRQLIGGPFSIAKAFGGVLPAKYSIGMVNHSGMTLSVTSIKIVPIFATVV